LVFAPVVHNHLSALDAKYDSLIRQKIEEQLAYEPYVQTRNRKTVRQPAAFRAEWELRFGPTINFGCSTRSIESIGKCGSLPLA
jgi:hypothetical protein